MKVKVLQVIAVAGFSLAVLAYGQSAPPAASAPAAPAHAGASPQKQPPLQLSTMGHPPAPKPISFPPPDPKNFTATSPTVKTVNTFLHQLWGYDPNRTWQVEGIQKTDAPGVVRVTVFVGEKGTSSQAGQTVFFVTPDGQHAVAGGQVVAFGSDPFASVRAKLEAGAIGPYRGASSKNLMLVEFSDLQCPHCKEGQATMDRLAKDFPNARIVYANFPLAQIHPEAEKAAEYGVCVAQLNGNDAFFKYMEAVFDTQANLTPTGADQALKDAATKAGADAAAMKKCVASPSTKAAVAASVKLGESIEVNQTPMLFINGRPVPLNAVPYDTLKQLVSFAAAQSTKQTLASATPPAQGKSATQKP